MYKMGLILLSVFFLALLFMNFFFKSRVIRHYKVLIKNEVEFTISDLFNEKKINAEVIPKYPQFAHDIEALGQNVRMSLKWAVILIALLLGVSALMIFA